MKHPNNLFKPVELNLDLSYEREVDLKTGVTVGASYSQMINVFAPLIELSDHNRKHNIYNRIDLQINYQVRVSDLTKKSTNVIEAPRLIQTPYMQVSSQTVTSEQGDEIGVDIHVRIKPFDLPTDQLSQYQAALNDTQDHGYWALLVRHQDAYPNLIGEKNRSDLNQIKSLIDQGSYDTALEAISAFLEKQDSPEGYYLKGLVLGFMNQFEQSEVAFGQAEAMGYEL